MSRRGEGSFGYLIGVLIALGVIFVTWPLVRAVVAAWRSPAPVRLRRLRVYLIPGLLCLSLGIGLTFYRDRYVFRDSDVHLYKGVRKALQSPAKPGPSTLKKPAASKGNEEKVPEYPGFQIFLWIFVPIWFGGLGIGLILSPLVALIRRPTFVITTREFWVRVRTFHRVKKAFKNRYRLPLGVDLRTGRVVSIAQRRRTSHVITLGATGTGKTTLLVNSVLHAIYHKQPCLVIDPKGEDSTLHQITEMGRALDPGLSERLKVFKLSNPSQSCTYNPLKHGNASQLKDRILEALNWSEQYYQSLAGDFLTLMTACTEKLNLPLNLDLVSKVLSEKTEQAKLLSKLKAATSPKDERGMELYRRMASLSERMKGEDLLGLHAQLSILNSPSIGPLLTSDFSKRENEIDLRRVLSRGQVAYFQLDTLGNPDTARRLGRIIIEDLKGLASHIYHSVPDENHRKFFPVFIDEFGSFASKEFIEALKQMRGTKIAVHLFTQGFEDLDVVSREFRRQAASNPLTKIGMRLDDNETVNELCAMAGTVESFEQSYQVDGRLLPIKTGMGNLRETRKMRVEHDVFKNLNTAQAVVIEKGPSRVSPIEVFHPRILFN